MATLETHQEVLPPFLGSNSEPPALFDGTTRLYTTYYCPFAQRAWIARNFKGLHDKIQLVPIDLDDRPTWYREKVYPPNKDPAKNEFTEELFAYSNTWNPTLFFYLKGTTPEDEMRAAFDKLEEYLSKYNDEGPFLLGAQFSAADVAYASFVQRYHPLFLDLHNYDITEGRPKLAAWIKALDTVEAFRQTRWDDEQNIKIYKRRNLGIV